MNDRREFQDMQGHEVFEEMAAAFALDALEESDLSEFRRHLDTGCELCAALRPEFERVASALLLAAEPAQPPSELRARILRAAGVEAGGPAKAPRRPITTSRPSDERRAMTAELRSHRERFTGILALAASVVLAIVSWLAFTMHAEIDATRERAVAAERRAAELENEIARLKTAADEQAALINLLRNPSSGLVTLASLKPAPKASGRILWDPKVGRGYLWVLGLPPDPEGKDYQLWAIIGGVPKSAGVFSVAADGSALLPLLDVGPQLHVAAFAITLEPAGGLPAPSGEMVLIGQTGA